MTHPETSLKTIIMFVILLGDVVAQKRHALARRQDQWIWSRI